MSKRKTMPWWIAIGVFIADRVTKALASREIAPFPLIPGVIGYRYARNTGMAFSLLSGRPWLLGAISLLILIAGFFALRRCELDGLSRVGAMLVLGGAVGNMADRFATGYVTDMLELLFMDFAIFNLADVCLTVGCGLMALSVLVHPAAWGRRERDGDGSDD